MNEALVEINQAWNTLAEAKTILDVKEIIDKAGAIEKYVKAIGLGLNAQNDVAQFRMEAMAKVGGMLEENIQRGGNPRSHDATLDDYGLNKTQSSRWQQIFRIGAERRHEYYLIRRSKDEEITFSGVLRLGRDVQDGGADIFVPKGKYRIIYADPPWKYGNTMPKGFGEQRDHYKAMTVSEVCELPIGDLAIDDSVLFLWVTSPILEESFGVINAWGFRYKTSFVWDKVKHVMGHYNSVRHEFLLLCTRGSCVPDVPKLFDSVVTYERGEHSVKPEFFREIIDTIYPNGSRIELFARRRMEGWDAWGDELS